MMAQKRQTKVSSFFQITSSKQGKVTFLTFSLNSIFSKFPHKNPLFLLFYFHETLLSFAVRIGNDDVVTNNSDNTTQPGPTTSVSNETTATQEKASAGNFSFLGKLFCS